MKSVREILQAEMKSDPVMRALVESADAVILIEPLPGVDDEEDAAKAWSAYRKHVSETGQGHSLLVWCNSDRTRRALFAKAAGGAGSPIC